MKIREALKKIHLHTAARFFLAFVFLASAYTKLIAPGLLEIIITDHGITGTRESAALLVRVLIAFEFSLGLLLLQKSFLKRIILPLVFLFLAGFTLYLAYVKFILSDTQNCGCFGAILQMNPSESILKNIFLLILTFYVYRKTVPAKNKIIIPIVLALVSFPAVFLISPVKGGGDFIFGRYTNFINAGRVDLTSGEKLVFLMTLDCDHCQQTARDVKELDAKYGLPEYFMLFFQDSDVTIDSFKSITKLNPPYRILGGEEFFEMIGTNPPRCYLIKDGKIIETWDTNIKEKLESRYRKSN